jgi:hypothetical protein
MDVYDRVGNAARDSAIRNVGGFVFECHLLSHKDRKDDVLDLEGVRAQLLPVDGGLRICKVPPGEKRSR